MSSCVSWLAGKWTKDSKAKFPFVNLVMIQIFLVEMAWKGILFASWLKKLNKQPPQKHCFSDIFNIPNRHTWKPCDPKYDFRLSSKTKEIFNKLIYLSGNIITSQCFDGRFDIPGVCVGGQNMISIGQVEHTGNNAKVKKPFTVFQKLAWALGT